MCNCVTFGVPSEQIRWKGCLQSAIVPNSKQCPYRGFPEEFWHQIQDLRIKKNCQYKNDPSLHHSLPEEAYESSKKHSHNRRQITHFKEHSIGKCLCIVANCSKLYTGDTSSESLLDERAIRADKTAKISNINYNELTTNNLKST